MQLELTAKREDAAKLRKPSAPLELWSKTNLQSAKKVWLCTQAK